MTHKELGSKHIIVTGFIGDKIEKPAKKINTGKQKLHKAEKSITAAKKDFEVAFNQTMKAFKQDATDKISQTEKRIQELKDKILDTSKEIESVSMDYIERLEESKKNLADKLNEYEEMGSEDWNSFKHQFSDEIDNFETSVTNFLQQQMQKNDPEDKSHV